MFRDHMKMHFFVKTGIIIAFFAWLAAPVSAEKGFNIAVRSTPYLESNLYAKPLLPNEGETVTITVSIPRQDLIAGSPVEAELILEDQSGKVVLNGIKPLRPEPAGPDSRTEGEGRGNTLSARWRWQAGANGLYRLRVYIDPLHKLEETTREDNFCSLILPVLAEGKKLHFVWYRGYEEPVRWATCITSTDQSPDLADRGVLPLTWEYGGESWNGYDKELAESDPEQVLSEIESVFYRKYTSPEIVYGVGIDECGGYPGTFDVDRSVASMKAMVRAKREDPDRVFAVWHAGKLNPPLAEWYRKGADFLLMESYIWSYIPRDLGTQDIYQIIRDRMDPLVRGYDMLVPAYGNWCYTLISLDTSFPWTVDVGEQEEVVRFIRKTYPEMAGFSVYNGSYKGRNEEDRKQFTAIVRNADNLFFEYYIKPCVTFNRNGLWLTAHASPDSIQSGPQSAGFDITASVANIGGIDSGSVKVEFYMDGVLLGSRTVSSIPAGANRLENTITLNLPYMVPSGFHTFEARIVDAPGSTVLDAAISYDRMCK